MPGPRHRSAEGNFRRHIEGASEKPVLRERSQNLGRRCKVGFLGGVMSWIWKKEHDLRMQERRRELFLLGEPMSASTHKWRSKAGICRPNVGPTRPG